MYIFLVIDRNLHINYISLYFFNRNFRQAVQVHVQKKDIELSMSLVRSPGLAFQRLLTLSNRVQRMSHPDKVYLVLAVTLQAVQVHVQKKDIELSMSLVRSPGLAFQRLLTLSNRVQRMSHPDKVYLVLAVTLQAVQVHVQKKTSSYRCLWCGHRDLNPDVVDIRPSNVRVCQFRHNRISSIDII